MAFNQVYILRLPTGLAIRCPHGAELPFGAGRQQTAVHIVGQPDAGNDRVDAITVSMGVLQTLQQEYACPFADNETVRLGVERRTTSRRR